MIAGSDASIWTSSKAYCGGKSVKESRYDGGVSISVDGRVIPAILRSSACLLDADRLGDPGCYGRR